MFTEESRQIFSFTIGGKTIFADPLELWQRVTAAFDGSDPDQLVQQSQSDAPGEKLAGTLALADKIRAAFELPAFDRATGDGVGIADCIRVWNEYWTWVAQKKMPSASESTSASASPGSQIDSSQHPPTPPAGTPESITKPSAG